MGIFNGTVLYQILDGFNIITLLFLTLWPMYYIPLISEPGILADYQSLMKYCLPLFIIGKIKAAYLLNNGGVGVGEEGAIFLSLSIIGQKL